MQLTQHDKENTLPLKSQNNKTGNSTSFRISSTRYSAYNDGKARLQRTPNLAVALGQ